MELKFNKLYKYKELQKIFNIYDKSGEQTIKDIEKEYKVKKVKRGVYKIERPLTEIEKLESRTYYKYREYIEPMIYFMLLERKENSFTMDMHEIMENVEIVNKDFHYIKYNLKKCSEIMNQNEIGLSIFTKESEPMLKRIVRDILYDMSDRQLIKCKEIPILAFKIYDSETKSWYTNLKKISSVKDVQKLLEVKRIILKEEFNLDRESELNYFEQGKFRDLIAEKYSASYFYYKYNIILNKKGLTQLNQENIEMLKKSFNQNIQNKLKKSKQGGLKELTKEEKDVYIDYCIDTSKDYHLRNGIDKS